MATNTGEIITFVLTAFSTIIVIIPFVLQPPSDNQVSDEINRLHALGESMDPHANMTEKLWAYSTLRDSNAIKSLFKNKPDLPEPNLAMALMHYNNNDIEDSQTSLEMASLINADSTTPCSKSDDICKRIWYLDRLLTLNKSSTIKSQWQEDLKCTKQSTAPAAASFCSESSLKNIDEVISGLAASGYISQFYNNKQPISILQKPVEAFISDLHFFIIVSLIAGPIIFVISIKHFGR